VRKISAAILSTLLLAVFPAAAVEIPAVVPGGDEDSGPYALTGLIGTYEAYGSGAVAAHPRVVLSCAHVVFSLDYRAWTSGAEFFRAWNDGTAPESGTGKLLSGYYYWRSYAAAAASTERLYATGKPALAAEAREFNQDFVAYFHHSTDLAGGDYAAVYDDGAPLLSDPSRQKIVTGYPSGRYNEGDPDEFRQHATSFTGGLLPETKSTKRYLTAYNIAETGSGNSGGPVWAPGQDGALAVAGVLVSGQEQPESEESMIGVHAVSDAGWRLIQSALGSTASADPVTQPFETTGGVIPDYATLKKTLKVSGMPKTVVSVTLDLEINHPVRSDLTVAVRAPGRKTAVVYDGAYDTETGPSIRLTAEQVAYFYGANANGVWTILIDDWELQDEGSLVAARLNISAR
jgi:hypothetical protein